MLLENNGSWHGGVAELPVDILWAENRFRCVSGPVAAPADLSTMEAQHLPLRHEGPQDMGTFLESWPSGNGLIQPGHKGWILRFLLANHGSDR